MPTETTTMEYVTAATALTDCMRRAVAQGLSHGSSGNASIRCPQGMWITPSGLEPEAMHATDTVTVDLHGKVLAGALRPSSEWPLHAAIYRARPDVDAILHCHSRHATALACCGRDIPAFHYMVAAAGGDSIRCAPYALFGSEKLAVHALQALSGRRACLLANHGQLTLGSNLGQAFALAVEVEELAAQYLAALTAGEPRLLDTTQMRAVIARFADYGAARRNDADD